MRIKQAISFFVICLALGIPSTALAAATPFPAPSGKVTAETSAKPAWQQRWEETLVAAKKEGAVRIALTGGPEIKNTLKNAFEKKFSIEAEFTMGNGTEQAGKIGAERRAGLFTTDIYCLGNSTSVAMIKPQGWLTKLEPVLILPEVTDPKAWRGGKIPYLDKDRTLIGFVSASSRRVVINTVLVKKGQIGSYHDRGFPLLVITGAGEWGVRRLTPSRF